jgi:hypothetical protein
MTARTKKHTSRFAKLVNLLITNPAWGLVIAIAISLVGNLLTIQYIFTLQNDLESMFNTDLIGQNYVQTARIKLLTINKEINKLFLLTDFDAKGLATEKILVYRRDTEALLAKSKPFFRQRKSSLLLTEATKLFAECSAAIDSAVAISKSENKGAEADAITDQVKTQFERLDAQLAELDQLKIKHDLRLFRNIDYQLSVSIVFTTIALVITIGIRILMYRRKKKLGKSRKSGDDGDRVVWG